MEFTTSVIASLVAGFLVLLSVFYYRKAKRIIVLNRLGSCELVFKDQSEAEDEILQNLKDSDWSNIFICRGYSLIESDRNYYDGIRNAKKCRILISLPKNSDGSFNVEVDKRVGELPSGKDIDAYVSNIEEVIQVLQKEKATNKNLQYRLHTEPIIFRLYMFPEYLYLSFFEENIGASKSRIYKYNQNSDFYKGLKKYFERVWERSS